MRTNEQKAAIELQYTTQLQIIWTWVASSVVFFQLICLIFRRELWNFEHVTLYSLRNLASLYTILPLFVRKATYKNSLQDVFVTVRTFANKSAPDYDTDEDDRHT